jgi:uncharacterized protein
MRWFWEADASTMYAMSTMTERIQTDLTTAMKAREQLEVSTLRMVLAAIKNAAVAGDEAVTLSDDQVMGVIRAEAKKRAESAEIYAQNDRAESAAKEQAELAVIERYLPAAMSDDALNAIVAGASGPKAMGGVIKAVRDRVGDGADGGRIAAAVKAALA